MTWLAPGYLAAGIAAAAAVIGVHLIMHRSPPVAPFPTARFIPPGSARAIRRAVRPDDVLLMALRIAIVLLIGAALARPVLTPSRRAVARVVVLDRSRAVGSIEDARERARSLLEEGDLLVVFDSVARLTSTAPDSVASIGRSGARGNLSAAIVAAIQSAPLLRAQAESIEIAIVSPALREELDAATAAIRATWAGRIRLVPVAPDSAPFGDSAEASPPGRRVDAGATVRAAAGDPVASALTQAGRAPMPSRTRIVRTALAPDDSAFAAGGGVVVHWPADGGELPAGDSIGAVVARGAVVVAGFARRPTPGASPGNAGSTPIAWWADGRAAAFERPTGTGCIRHVDIDVPRRGDLVLREPFRRLLQALSAPCGGAVDQQPASAPTLAALAGDGRLLPTSALPVPERASAIAPWLLAAALLLALVEPLLRRRQGAA